MRARRTLARPVARGGLGVHSGQPCHAAVGSAPCGAGIRVNGGLATIDAVRGGVGATVLDTPAGPVRMVEHLLAALAIAGIDDAAIVVAGGEVPILDGSAAGWPVEARMHGGTLAPVALAAPVVVEGFGGWIRAIPAATLVLDVTIDHPDIGAQQVTITDLTTLTAARTFGRAADLARLQAAGLAHGADHTNTLALDRPLLGWRHPDEPVRHKALDLLGDLALLGRPLRAHVRAHRSSHRLHHRLVAAILDQTRPA